MWWILIVLTVLIIILISNQKASPSVTAVSGYWNIHSKHSPGEYSKWFDNTLALNCPYVFFYEDEKVKLVQEAAKRNVYGTEWFMWVDAGNALYRDRKPPASPWPNSEINLPTDKIIYTGSNAPEHDFAGTAFMYHKDMCDTVSDLFYEQFELCSKNENNWTCGSDQCLFTELKKRKPEMFYRVGEGYGNLIENV